MAVLKHQTSPRFFKEAIFALTILVAPVVCGAQARQMPTVEGKTLAGNTVRLPSNDGGNSVVLVFGFARSAKQQGVAWGKELVTLQQQDGDFDFYQVAVLDGAPKFTHGLITRAIRAEVPTSYYSHTLLMTSGEEAWKKALGVAENDEAYVAICSPSGEIRWKAKGVREEQFAGLREQLRTEVASR